MQACITHRIIAHPKKTHITHNVSPHATNNNNNNNLRN
jgi:hypothetical protein